MPGAVSKIAEFLNRKLTPGDVKKICEHCSLVNMKENVMLNLDYYKNYKKVHNHHGNFINTGERNSILQGPVVQSIVSLTSSLRGQLVKCFTTL